MPSNTTSKALGQPRAVGHIVKSHGLRGELVVEVRTDSPQERFAPGSVLDAHNRDGFVRTLTVAAARPHAGRLLVTFTEATDRNAADALRGLFLCTDIADLPSNSDPDEFYDHELEGLDVELSNGEKIGEVQEVLHLPIGEVLAVRTATRDDLLIPFVSAIVPVVDVAAGKVIIDPPDGLLDES